MRRKARLSATCASGRGNRRSSRSWMASRAWWSNPCATTDGLLQLVISSHQGYNTLMYKKTRSPRRPWSRTRHSAHRAVSPQVWCSYCGRCGRPWNGDPELSYEELRGIKAVARVLPVLARRRVTRLGQGRGHPEREVQGRGHPEREGQGHTEIYSQCRSPPRGRAPEDLRFQEFYMTWCCCRTAGTRPCDAGAGGGRRGGGLDSLHVVMGFSLMHLQFALAVDMGLRLPLGRARARLRPRPVLLADPDVRRDHPFRHDAGLLLPVRRGRPPGAGDPRPARQALARSRRPSSRSRSAAACGFSTRMRLSPLNGYAAFPLLRTYQASTSSSNPRGAPRALDGPRAPRALDRVRQKWRTVLNDTNPLTCGAAALRGLQHWVDRLARRLAGAAATT